MLFFKRRAAYSSSLRNIFCSFTFPRAFQPGQEPTARQEGLFESRLPPGPLTSVVSLIVLELSSLLFPWVTLSGLMKKDSFHLNPAPYTQASLEPSGISEPACLFFDEEKDKMFLDPQGRPGCWQESWGGLIPAITAPGAGQGAAPYSRRRRMGWQQAIGSCYSKATHHGWLRRVSQLPGKHPAARAQTGLAF